MALPGASSIQLSAGAIRSRTRIATVGLLAAWLVVFMLLYGNLDPSVVNGDVGAFLIIGNVALAASCLLWIVMLLEYIRERPAEYRYVWLLLLLTGPVVGPLLFYYGVWRKRYPRHVPNKPLERTRER
jgi:hypothetical protein